MNGQSHWIDIAFLLVGVAGVAALFLSSWWVGRSLRTEARTFVCPRKGSVEATLVQDTASGRWLGVRRCTAFKDPDFVTCSRECVDELNEQEARRGASAVLLAKSSR